MTESAQCAKLIRAELKLAFPGVKFSVRSQQFAGGDSVDIGYQNGPTYDAVNAIVKKYQDGDFDGMIDLYEYRPNPQNLPRAKYVMVQRDITNDIREATKIKIAKEYGIPDINDEQLWRKYTGAWSNERVYRDLQGMTL